jgi:hypothetical protein
MAWEKGQSGNPQGGARVKPWRDALRRSIARYDADHPAPGTFWDAMADHVRDEALVGDRGCRQEIVERFDGKVPTLVGGDDESPVQVIHTIRREFVELPADRRRKPVVADTISPLLEAETIKDG